MEYKEFLEYVTAGVQKMIGESARASVIQVEKNNGVKLDGLIIRDGKKNVSPAIYLELYYVQYTKGRAKADIINEIYQIYHKYSCTIQLNAQDFSDYKRLCRKVAYKIVNFEKNQELLAKIPYVRYLDMAIVFFVAVQCRERNELENAAFLVRDEHLKMWKVEIGDVYRDALYNTPELFPAQICPMTEALAGAVRESGEEELKEELEYLRASGSVNLYILTNQKKVNGASCILYKNVIKDFAREKGTNLYLIPSSVHEVLLVPDTGDFCSDELKAMVREVNDTELEQEEILSYSIYYYDAEKDVIQIDE